MLFRIDQYHRIYYLDTRINCLFCLKWKKVYNRNYDEEELSDQLEDYLFSFVPCTDSARPDQVFIYELNGRFLLDGKCLTNSLRSIYAPVVEITTNSTSKVNISEITNTRPLSPRERYKDDFQGWSPGRSAHNVQMVIELERSVSMDKLELDWQDTLCPENIGMTVKGHE